MTRTISPEPNGADDEEYERYLANYGKMAAPLPPVEEAEEEEEAESGDPWRADMGQPRLGYLIVDDADGTSGPVVLIDKDGDVHYEHFVGGRKVTDIAECPRVICGVILLGRGCFIQTARGFGVIIDDGTHGFAYMPVDSRGLVTERYAELAMREGDALPVALRFVGGPVPPGGKYPLREFRPLPVWGKREAEGPRGAPADQLPAGANGPAKPFDYNEACAEALQKARLPQGDYFKASLEDYAKRDAAQTSAEHAKTAALLVHHDALEQLAFALFATDAAVLAYCKKAGECIDGDEPFLNSCKLDAALRKAWALGDLVKGNPLANCVPLHPRECAWRQAAYKRSSDIGLLLASLSTKPL